MTGRVLVTTALEETWPEEGQALFLGDWCIPHRMVDRAAGLDHVTMDHPWSDPDRLDRDRDGIRYTYEEVLGRLSDRLDELHGTRLGRRAWRIIVGPWLQTFTTVVFDRWSSIQQAVQQHDLDHTVVLEGPGRSTPPQRLGDFRRWDLQDDRWNHDLYAEIIRWDGRIDVRTLSLGGEQKVEASPAGRAGGPGWRRRLERTVFRALAAFAREDGVCLYNTYLPPWDEMAVQWRLGQVPVRWHSLIGGAGVWEPVEPEERGWGLDGGSSGDDLVGLLGRLVPLHLPAAYLEDHERLRSTSERIGWPARPSLIWTSLVHGNSDLFRTWAGTRVAAGSKLVVGQHGGGYGTAECFAAEDHERSVADAYLTWGWDDPDDPRVLPVGQFKAQKPLGVDHSLAEDLLLVVEGVPRFNHRTDSIGLAHHWSEYFEDLCGFAGELPDRLRKALLVRLPVTDQGRGEADLWQERLPEVRLDHGGMPMDHLISGTRLYVATYNSTTYLQTFTMDVPTVCFWNPDRWRVRSDADPYFRQMVDAGILHHDFASAARHVSSIWDDVHAWWRSDEVVEARLAATRRFSHLPEDIRGEVAAALEGVLGPGWPDGGGSLGFARGS